MKAFATTLLSASRFLATLALLATSSLTSASELPAILNDFSHAQKTSLGMDRIYVDDTSTGGQTTTQYSVAEGRLTATGTIVPPRGQPGWASVVFLLNTEGAPIDAGNYEGIRLVVKIEKGKLSVSANSSVVTNFDFHASTVALRSDGKFHEVKIPFRSLKRAWSEQTPLDPGTITSLSIVAFDVQKGTFHFEVDELGFY